MFNRIAGAGVALSLWLAGAAAWAQPAPAAVPNAAAKAPDKLVLLFDVGSASVRAADMAVLDQASRLYRDGKPIVMVVSGSTDATGAAAANLRLSQQRADNVLQGLVARGIPAERFQVLAKGVTDPVDQTSAANAQNRRVEITWR